MLNHIRNNMFHGIKAPEDAADLELGAREPEPARRDSVSEFIAEAGGPDLREFEPTDQLAARN